MPSCLCGYAPLPRAVLALLFGLLLASCAAPKAEGPLAASGVIQAREVTVAAEFAGRVQAVAVQEGDSVLAGAKLVVLDDAVAQSNLAQADAALQTATADLNTLKAGSRKEEIAAAQAQVAQADAAVAGAESALRNATAVRANPQDLDAKLAAAKAQTAQAVQGVEAAKSDLERATFERDRLTFNSTEWHAAEFQRASHAAALEAAQANLSAAQAYEEGLAAMRARPLALLAAEHKAAGNVAMAQAARQVAAAKLEDLQAGPRAEEVAVAEAKVRLAQAQANALRDQSSRLTLAAPSAGVVLARLMEPGEAVVAGTPLVRLGDLQRLDLTLYVPETRIGQVHLGQAVNVTVDSFPGRTFAGTVTLIGDQPEYTPRNIATREERVNTFYAVRVSLPNPDGALKPGMPADGTFK